MTEPTINEEELADRDAATEADSDEGAPTSTSPETTGESEGADARPPATDEEGHADLRSDEGSAASDAGEETELATLRAEFEELNDRHLRLVAEFNNFRRRSEQERLSAWARAQADLVSDLLDVLDDIQRVADLDLSNATVEAIMEGIDLVERKFLRQLTEAGVEVIEPTGEPFDPERMEAMMRVPAEEDEQVDTVAQVFQKGYSLKGILVRPARVSVYTQG